MLFTIRRVTTWLKRLLYLVLFVLWLLVMSFPISAAILAINGQIEVGSQQSAHHVRVFLVQERNQEGIGLEWTRQASVAECRQGSITYAMWEGSAENARYCTCIDATGSVIRSEPGTCSVDQ